jgi:hypothetical protein
MRTKHFIIATMLATLPLAECLADGVRFLVVNGKDGTKTAFALADTPKVSCKGGDLTVIAGSRTFTLSLADVQNYQFAIESTGIEDVVKDGSVKMENGCAVFSGLNAGGVVSVYLQDGRLLRDCKADDGGNAVVELSSMPKGILIIHSNKTDIKIINR